MPQTKAPCDKGNAKKREQRGKTEKRKRKM